MKRFSKINWISQGDEHARVFDGKPEQFVVLVLAGFLDKSILLYALALRKVIKHTRPLCNSCASFLLINVVPQCRDLSHAPGHITWG
jgi:hypothetical protein